MCTEEQSCETLGSDVLLPQTKLLAVAFQKEKKGKKEQQTLKVHCFALCSGKEVKKVLPNPQNCKVLNSFNSYTESPSTKPGEALAERKSALHRSSLRDSKKGL